MQRYKVVRTTVEEFYIAANTPEVAEKIVARNNQPPSNLINNKSTTVCQGEWTDLQEYTLSALDGDDKLHFRYVYAPNEFFAKEDFDSAFDWNDELRLHQVATGHLEPYIPTKDANGT
jgi:hypothetical protein